MRVTTLFTPDRVVGRLISTLNKTGVELTVGLKRVDLIAIVANGTLDAEVLAVIAHRLVFKRKGTSYNKTSENRHRFKY